MTAQAMEPEDWMEKLKAKVDAGVYRREDTERGRGRIPWERWREPIHFETPADCFLLLFRVAETFGWTVQDAAQIVFLLGLQHYCDDRRRSSGKVGLNCEAASREQSRLINAYDDRPKGRGGDDDAR
jgi:hypothetical protein